MKDLRSLIWKCGKKHLKSLGYFCSSTMLLRFLAALFKQSVSGILEQSIVRNPEKPEIQNYEWTAEGKRNWVEKMFLDDINDKLVLD